MFTSPDFRNAIRIGDAADALSQRSATLDPAGSNEAMTIFCAALFRGEFDGPVLHRRANSKRQLPPLVARTLQVPRFVGVRADRDSARKLPSLYHGMISGNHRDVVYLAFEFGVGDLPGEGTISEAAWKRAAAALSQAKFEDFPEPLKALLRSVLIARPKLDLWLAERGLELPRSVAHAGAPVPVPANSNEMRDCNTGEGGRRGRPTLAAWPRIRELVRELHTADPKRYHKCMAQDVRELIADEFDPGDIPQASTIQARIPDLLGKRSHN